MTTALAALPTLQRQVVVLTDLCGFGYDEAATLLGIAPGTVASRLHRGRQALGNILAPEGEAA